MKNYQLKNNILIGIVIGLCIVVIAMASVIWMNYDYIFFKFFISNDYIFTDTLDKMYKDTLSVDIKSEKEYYKYFDNIAISLISEKIKTTGNDPYTYQYTPSQYSSYIENRSEKANMTHTELLNENTILLKYTNFSDESMDIFKKSVKTINDYSRIIIDLRDNTGGGLDEAYELSSYFLNPDDISYIIKYRDKLEPAIVKSNKILDFQKIIILQNNNTASASEIFINALKENLDNVITVGVKSFGKGIGQTTYSIKNGFHVKATTFLVLTPNQNSIHSIGIVPDYLYEDEETIIDFCMSLE